MALEVSLVVWLLGIYVPWTFVVSSYLFDLSNSPVTFKTLCTPRPPRISSQNFQVVAIWTGSHPPLEEIMTAVENNHPLLL